MYGVLVCWIVTAVTYNRRAMSGISGRSARQQRVLGAAIVVALVAVSVYQGAREDWPAFGVAIAIVLVATGSAFAGPRGVWLRDGIGLGVVVLGFGAAQAWLQRR
jgi:hypothetical protein